MVVEKVHRGQLRPHFAGRSPPLLLAVLLLGIFLLSISYYSLSSQYNQLEEKYQYAIQMRDQLRKDNENDKHTLHSGEREISSLKVDVGLKEQEIQKLQDQLRYLRIQSSSNSDGAQKIKEKCQEDLKSREQELGAERLKVYDLESQVKDLKLDNDRLKSSNVSAGASNVGEPEDKNKAVAPPPDAGIADSSGAQQNGAISSADQVAPSPEKQEDTNAGVNAKNSLEAPKLEIDVVPGTAKVAADNNAQVNGAVGPKEANLVPPGDDSLFDAAGSPNDQDAEPHAVDDLAQDRVGNSLNDN